MNKRTEATLLEDETLFQLKQLKSQIKKSPHTFKGKRKTQVREVKAFCGGFKIFIKEFFKKQAPEKAHVSKHGVLLKVTHFQRHRYCQLVGSAPIPPQSRDTNFAEWM